MLWLPRLLSINTKKLDFLDYLYQVSCRNIDYVFSRYGGLFFGPRPVESRMSGLYAAWLHWSTYIHVRRSVTGSGLHIRPCCMYRPIISMTQCTCFSTVEEAFIGNIKFKHVYVYVKKTLFNPKAEKNVFLVQRQVTVHIHVYVACS